MGRPHFFFETDATMTLKMRSLSFALAQCLLLLPTVKSFTNINVPKSGVSPLFQSKEGDPFRAATGIRPSLHPVTINALAEALKVRAQNLNEMPMRVTKTVEPLQVALTAGRIASEAVEKRQRTSEKDGMSLTAEEEQTIAGRVVGVIMRLEELEMALYEKCESTGWIAKYNEWTSFGVLKDESNEKEVDAMVLTDPLFGMNRAECLLALFLNTVEAPGLEKNNASVPDASQVDFLDEDRREVLLV